MSRGDKFNQNFTILRWHGIIADIVDHMYSGVPAEAIVDAQISETFRPIISSRIRALCGLLFTGLLATGLTGCDAQAEAPCYGDAPVVTELPNIICIDNLFDNGGQKEPESATKARYVDNVRAEQTIGETIIRPFIFEMPDGRTVFAGLHHGSAETVIVDEGAINKYCLLDGSKPAIVREASLQRDVSSRMFLANIGIHMNNIPEETCQPVNLPGVLPHKGGTSTNTKERITTTSTSATTSTIINTTTSTSITSSTFEVPRPTSTRVTLTLPATTSTTRTTSTTVAIVSTTTTSKAAPVVTRPPGVTLP